MPIFPFRICRINQNPPTKESTDKVDKKIGKPDPDFEFVNDEINAGTKQKNKQGDRTLRQNGQSDKQG